MEKERKGTRIEKYHHKVNADITQIHQERNNLYEKHGPTGIVQGQKKGLA